MNYQELEEKINAAGIDEVCNEDVEKDFPAYTFVEEIGGGEGGGESVVRVAHFPESDIFVKFTGDYQSYDGTTWNDEFEQVFPKQRVVTKYENAVEAAIA